MIRSYLRIIFPAAFLAFYLNTKAQVYYDDAQVWFNLYLEKKIGKHFDIHLNQQDRFTNNVSQFGLAYADMGITYKFTQNIKLLVDYVYIQKRRNMPYFKTRHQYYAALIFKKDFGYWRVSYRNMFQCQYNSPLNSYDGYIPYYYDRNKLTVKYQASKRFDFYVAEEVNIPINNPQIKGLSRSRTFAGVFITTRKHQQLEFYYMYQVQLQKGDWYNQDVSYRAKMLTRKFVYGIGYQIQF
jgi:hypothetical protein